MYDIDSRRFFLSSEALFFKRKRVKKMLPCLAKCQDIQTDMQSEKSRGGGERKEQEQPFLYPVYWLS